MKSLLSAVLVVLLSAATGRAQLIGQVETFSGPTVTWGDSSSVVADGGPNGSGDAFLLVQGSTDPQQGLLSTGGPAWEGDYIAQHVRWLSMDLNNFGPDPLSVRFIVAQFGPGGDARSLGISAVPILLPANSGWTRVRFDLSLAALSGAAEDALRMQQGPLGIFHSIDGVNPFIEQPPFGQTFDPANAALGIDNITASAVPEPSTIWVAFGAAALGAVGAWRRRWRKQG